MESLPAAGLSEEMCAPLTPARVRPRRESYVFADNVRFLAMASFFVEHSIPTADGVLHWQTPWYTNLMICITKFGTVGFFMVSGFLLGKNIETAGPLGYLKKRLDRIFFPWCFWVSIFSVAMVVQDWRAHPKSLEGLGSVFAALGIKMVDMATYTPYWFVPQLLIALCALLLFRRHLGSLWLGAALGAVSLFYAANVYLHWLPPSHMMAFFGFTFYLWLGYFVSHRLTALDRLSARIPWWSVLGLVVLLGFASYGECRLVGRLFPHDDPANSLRLTSQIYSLAVVFLLYKIRIRTWPKFVDVRNETFGLYLIQPQTIYCVGILVYRSIPPAAFPALQNPRGAVLLWIVIVPTAYLTTLGITKFLLSYGPLRWMVGGAPLAAGAEASAQRIRPSAVAQSSDPELSPGMGPG